MENVMDNDSNNGFWDRPADERAERMRKAADRGEDSRDE